MKNYNVPLFVANADGDTLLHFDAVLDFLLPVYDESEDSLLYSDYDVMDSDAIVASSLDIIADECTLKNDLGEVLQIRSSNDDIQKILYNLFYDVLNIEFNLWSWIRQMCKYGDFFLKLEIFIKFNLDTESLGSKWKVPAVNIFSVIIASIIFAKCNVFNPFQK